MTAKYVASGSWDQTIRVWDVFLGTHLVRHRVVSDRLATLAPCVVHCPWCVYTWVTMNCVNRDIVE